MNTIEVSNKKISRMMLGTVQLGLLYGVVNATGKPSLEASFKILDAAVEGGITALDTAQDYGNSEEVIGEYLRNRKEYKEKLFIATKFKLKEERGDLEKIIFRKVENSLKTLGVDSIDMLLMHESKEYSINPSQIDKTLAKLKNQGMVKKVGVSSYDYVDIAPMIDNDLYEAYQLPMNMLDQRLDIPDVKKKLENKYIFTRSVYLKGLFFMKQNQIVGNVDVVKNHVKTVQTIAKEMEISVAKLAMGYVNSLSYVDSLVIGCETVQQVKENIELISNSYITEEQMKNIQERLKGVPTWIFYPWLWDLKEGL